MNVSHKQYVRQNMVLVLCAYLKLCCLISKKGQNDFYTFNIQNKTKLSIKLEYQFEIHVTITKGSQFYLTNLTIALNAPKQTVMKSLVICITYWTFQIKFSIHRCFKIFFSKTNTWVHFFNTSVKTFFTEIARPVPKIYRGLLSHRQLYTLCVDSKHYPFSKLLKHTHRCGIIVALCD